MTDQVSAVGQAVEKAVEQTLDILLFAPLGVAMTARTQMPEMAAKGRAHLEGQLTVARFLGQFAVKHGREEAEKRVKAYTGRGSAPASPAGSEPEPTAAREATVEPRAVLPPAGDLAIPGYAALSASQVVARLAGLSPAELELVRQYEAATRGRKTVLNKISQLQ